MAVVGLKKDAVDQCLEFAQAPRLLLRLILKPSSEDLVVGLFCRFCRCCGGGDGPRRRRRS